MSGALRGARGRIARLLFRAGARIAGGRTVDGPLDFLLSEGVARGSDRRLLAGLAQAREFERLRKRCRIVELPLAAILPGADEAAIPLGAANFESGHSNHAEMLYVVAAAKLLGARRIFEFGTYLGRTTFHLAEAIPEATVTTLDLPREDNPWAFADDIGIFFRDAPSASRITQLRADSRSFDPGQDRHGYDFIWVDGDHSYEAVQSDTRTAFELLQPGGAILWHDFGPDSLGLARFFSELTQAQPLFRIRRTSVLMHLDGVDPESFEPLTIPFAKGTLRAPAAR